MTGAAPGPGARLGAGREAEVYAWGDAAVLKLYRHGFGSNGTEATALRSLGAENVAPRLLDVVDHDARTGLVMERVDGPDMLTLLNRKPWRVLGLADALATAHLAVHRVAAPAGPPDLRQALTARIRDAALPPHLRDLALRVVDRLPDGDRLCHGDFHPGNVLLAGDRTAVIDWPGATRGVPEADHARTLLLLRWADPLPDTSLRARALIATGRSVLARRYARSYRRGAAPLRHVDPWLLAHAAARLSEGIEAERPMLTGVLDRAHRTARYRGR